VQAQILTITERADDAARQLEQLMKKAGLRVETDLRNEKIGFKVREAQMMKVPYMLVIGDREAQEGTVSVRTRKGDTKNGVSQQQLISALLKEEDAKTPEQIGDFGA
jgi:threonyl-tRNA synthetase